MKLTRVIAVGVILGSIAVTAPEAQTLRNAQPPAEFPPATYKGNQYVDSRGCIYIRAGIDGNVTWVPRVSRSRKQVCGYQPTAVAGAGSAPASAAPAATVITVAPAATAPAPAPAPVATPRPTATVATPRAPAPAPTVRTTTRTTTARPPATPTYRAPAAAPVATTTATTAPAPIQPRTAPAATGGCPNASAFSQQFINKSARCGPQAEPPITYGQGWDRSSSLALPPDTRIVPRHVYDKRQNTTNVSVPPGYKTVWEDDRLNPHRAERSPAPAVMLAGLPVPPGYKRVDRDDDRLNTKRGYRTVEGANQTDRIWTRTVPRDLAPVETSPVVVTLTGPAAASPAEAQPPALIRISSRSAPGAAAPVAIQQPQSTPGADHRR